MRKTCVQRKCGEKLEARCRRLTRPVCWLRCVCDACPTHAARATSEASAQFQRGRSPALRHAASRPGCVPGRTRCNAAGAPEVCGTAGWVLQHSEVTGAPFGRCATIASDLVCCLNGERPAHGCATPVLCLDREYAP